MEHVQQESMIDLITYVSRTKELKEEVYRSVRRDFSKTTSATSLGNIVMQRNKKTERITSRSRLPCTITA